MIIKSFVLAAGMGIVAFSASANQLTSEQAARVDIICTKTPCRTGGYDVVVRVNETTYTNIPVGRSPFVTPEGEILIYPGETVAVQFTVSGDTLSSPHFVAQYATRSSLAMKLDTGSKLIDNALDTSLPQVPRKDDHIDLPANTLLLTYGQYKDHPGMNLIMETNITRRIKLDAEMSLIKDGGYEWHYTSTCPLGAGSSSYESWPGEHGPMMLSNLRFLPEKGETACK